MGISISGDIAVGASQQLDKVLQRRLQEMLRQQQEQQRAEQVQMQRQRLALDERQQASIEEDRAAERQRAQQQANIATAGRTYQTLKPGDITEPEAQRVEQDPALAGLVRRSQRPIIDARPIAGTAPLDTSGPQSLPVVELLPTGAQATAAQRLADVRDLSGRLRGAKGSDARRNIALERPDLAGELPDYATEETEEEKRAAEQAKLNETRAYARGEWDRQHAITQRDSGGGRAGRQGVMDAYNAERALRVTQTVDDLLGRVSSWNVGPGRLLAYIPGSEAADFDADLTELKANIAFNELAAMRAASPTGGALGAVSERELAFLESALGALSTMQSAANFKANLQQIKDSIARWDKVRREEEAKSPMRPGAGTAKPSGDIDARIDALLKGGA